MEKAIQLIENKILFLNSFPGMETRIMILKDVIKDLKKVL